MEGNAQAQGPHPADGDRRGLQLRAGGRVHAESGRAGSLIAGDVGFVIAGIKELKAARVGDTVTLATRRAAGPLPGFKEVQAAGFRRPLSGRSQPVSRRCATRSRSSSSTTRRCTTSRKSRRRSASVFAAASWACCTWTSCRSGSSASTTWTCDDRSHGRLPGAAARTARCSRSRIRRKLPDLSQRRGDSRADHHRDDPGAAGLCRAAC